jgi:hypothetical protein
MTWLIASRSRAGKFANIRHELLGEFVRYCTILRLKTLLEQWGIIGCDGEYSVGKKSLGYRICDDAAESEVVQYAITSRTCLKRLGEKPRQQLLPKTDLQRWLCDCLLRTRMDEPAARHIANNLAPKHRLRAHASIDWFTQGWLWFKPDNFGRIHTNVTNLKRELRPTLHFGDGEPLVEIDIRCSQPTMLYGMLPKDAREATDSLAYLELCRSGELYTVVGAGMSRGEAKGAFFHFLYSHQVEPEDLVRKPLQDPARELARRHRFAIDRIMASRFPTISRFIKQTKRMRGHKRFSHQMQRRESQIIIAGVCGRTWKDKPGVSILTIHDSLITGEPTARYIHTTVKETLHQSGINATTTTKTLAPPSNQRKHAASALHI